MTLLLKDRQLPMKLVYPILPARSLPKNALTTKESYARTLEMQ